MQQEQDPTIADQSLGSNGQAPTSPPQSDFSGQTEAPPVPNPTTVTTDSGIIAAGEIPRSGAWHGVEQAHLNAHPACAACGLGQPGQGLQVHHMLPFHFCVKLGRPELELDERNLMTLCDKSINNHHLLLGHLGDFQSYNPSVKADVAGSLGHLGDDQIDADPSWQAEMRQRPPFLEHMNANQIAAFKVLMDTWYPPQPDSNSGI
ncbi:MAG: hypothetical protein ABI406_01235 [Ktedonobacteraceae bacterium]